MHAGWNLASKWRSPSGAFFLLATTASLLLLAPAFALTWSMVHAAPFKCWGMLALSGAAETVYYIALAYAYRSGEMSIAYPAARSIPALLIPPATALLGLGERISSAAIFGMALVFLGCLLLPLASFRSARTLTCGGRTLGFMLLAAISITVYSIVDSEGLKLLKESAPGLGKFKASMFYISWTNAFIMPYLAAFVLLSRMERAELAKTLSLRGLAAPLACGPVCSIGYTFTLLAMASASNVGYVIALKQMSIPIGVSLGLLLLKEKASAPKLTGASIMTAGLILIAI